MPEVPNNKEQLMYYYIIKDNGDRIYIRQPHTHKTAAIKLTVIAICLMVIAIVLLL